MYTRDIRFNGRGEVKLFSNDSHEHFVYKKEVDLSLLKEGLAIPIDYQVVFGKVMNRYLARGESKPVTIYLNGISYQAKIHNLNIDIRDGRKQDKLQLRYPPNGELAKALQGIFSASHTFIENEKRLREPGSRKRIILPDEYKEYLVIYTTEDADTYIFEPIQVQDLREMKAISLTQSERTFETVDDRSFKDPNAGMVLSEGIRKIRKLDRKIGDNLKLLYGYRCQICGCTVGMEFDHHVAEAHHIEYYVRSLNNDASNQIILCPNHHRLIHEADPVFDRRRLVYVYDAGKEQKITLDKHLRV